MGLTMTADQNEEQRRRLDEIRRQAEESEQQYFRGSVVPKHVQKGLNKLLIEKGEKKKGKKEEAPKEVIVPEGERKEEMPTIKIREYPALKIGFYSKRETPKEDYERAVRVQALLILESEIAALGKGRAWDVFSKIQGEKVRNADASLFSLIQEEIRELKTKPDEEIEAGLKSARNFLVESAKAHGIFKDVKGLIYDAQKEDWGQAKIEFRERINVASLEHAARGIEGWTTDFAGMIDEYVDAAMLNMDLAELRARGEGESDKAEDVKREISLRGWGNPPVGLEKMAKEHFEKTGERKEEVKIEIKRVVIDRRLSREETKELDIYERDILEACLAELQKTVDLVGDNENIFPYKEFLLGSIENLRKYVKDKEEELIDISVENKGIERRNDFPERTKLILERIERVADWLEGNGAVLLSAGVVLKTFFDGYMMLNAVKQLRKDVRQREMDKVYSAPERGKWNLGKEIAKKQNQAFEILRGIAAAHRHKGRNVGIEIPKDYLVTPNQIKFIEEVFASGEKYLRTSKVSGKEVAVEIKAPESVEVIAGVREKNKAINELEKCFSINQGKRKKVVIGEQIVITKELVHSLSLGKLQGTLWVDGVEWKLDESRASESLEDIREALEDKIGSGDGIFLGEGEIHDVNKDNFKRVVNRTRSNQRVGLIEETPSAIDNLFVMTQTAEGVDETKEKIEVMIEMGSGGEKSIWERLEENDADVKKIREEFEEKRRKYKEDKGNLLNKHIVDMSRIVLLFSLEGADLGWGFEYQDTEIGRGEKQTLVTMRVVEGGGTKAATDINAPLKWLYTQAGNNWKNWTTAALPFDKRTAKQIREHYPGWAPKMTGDGKWEIRFMEMPITIDVPTTIDLAFFNTQTVPVETEKGVYKDRTIMELIKDRDVRLKMSQIPYMQLMPDEARYIQFIDEAQSRVLLPLTKPIDRDTREEFFGEPMFFPRATEVEEMWKRLDLTFRHIGKLEIVKKFAPLLAFLNLGMRHNMFPSAERPGVFSDGKVKSEARNIANVLRRMEPKGDVGMGQEMADSLGSYVKQFIPPCGEFDTRESRRWIKNRARSILGGL